MRAAFYAAVFLAFLLHLWASSPLALWPACVIAAGTRALIVGLLLTPAELAWGWLRERRVSGS
jgi:hypothetical protein